MTNLTSTTWLTQSEAARRLGVSREAIRQAIAARRIDWNGRSGRDCRVRGDLQQTGTLPPLSRAAKRPADPAAVHAVRKAPAPKKPAPAAKKSARLSPADQILDARLRKLESDIQLQTMRLESQKKEIYDQAISDMIAAYESAFAPLKKLLLSLDLPAETLQKIAATADQCDAEFQAQIRP